MPKNSPTRPAASPSRTASTKPAAPKSEPTESKQTNSPSGNKAVNWLRTIAASILGIIALYLIVSCVTLYWFNHTIADTDKFTSVTSSLATKPAIQDFVTQKATDTITDNLNNEDITSHFLTPEQAAQLSPDQLKATAKPQVQAAVSQIVKSPQFSALWSDTTKRIQTQTVDYLNGPATGDLTLDFKPTVDGLVSLLEGTKLSFVQPKDLTKDKAQVTIKSDKTKNVHDAYQKLRHAPLVTGIAAAVAVALTILVARKRLHAVRHLSMLLAIGMGLAAASIYGLSQVKLTGNDLVQKQAAVSFLSTTLHGLMQLDLIVAIIALVIFVATFFVNPLRRRFAPSSASKALREL